MDPLNATIVATTFDVYDLLNKQCDEPLPEEFEDAYGSPRSLLFFALAAIPARHAGSHAARERAGLCVVRGAQGDG